MTRWSNGVGPPGRAHREDGEHAARLHERGDERPGQLVELVAVVDQQEQTLVAGPLAQRRRGPVEDRATVEVVRAGRGGDVDRQQVRQRGERDRSTLGVTARPGARHAGRIGELEDLLREPGLADAGAAGEEHAAGGVARGTTRRAPRARARARSSATPRPATVRSSAPGDSTSELAPCRADVPLSRTAATKRKPRPCTVLITRCWAPSSPTARRAALIRVVSADSLTKRSPHTLSSSSFFVTTRSRCSTRYARTLKTCGSMATGTPARRSSKTSVSSSNAPNEKINGRP